MHQQRHQRDDQQHHHRGTVEQHADLDVEAPVLEPRPRPLDRLDREVRLLCLVEGFALLDTFKASQSGRTVEDGLSLS